MSSAQREHSPARSRPRGEVEAEPLVAEGVRGSYALAGVDLRVRAGELVCVLGPNGAGKTTLLRLLAGTLAPAAGVVRLFGSPVHLLPRREVARALAVVAQDEEPAFGWSVRDVVMMGRAPHQGGAWLRATREDDAIVREALERCDLTALAARPVTTLSGGERKRVTIARALAQAPRVLLLDEPAAFLDVRHQLALYDILVTEVERSSLACVVVMHDLNVAAQYAHTVALLKEGRLVACGPPREVMTPERLREVFDVELVTGRLSEGDHAFFLPRRR